MFAQTPLVKDLDNPQYMNVILNGKGTLSERFAEIDIVQVHKAFAEEQKGMQQYQKAWQRCLKYLTYQGSWGNLPQKRLLAPKSKRLLRQ